MIVISDTTPILSLLKADRLELLEMLYQTVIVPETVFDELTCNVEYKDEREEIANCPFLSVEKVSNMDSVDILRNVTGLDAGESEALVLYQEKKADVLLIDERKGRGVAKKMCIEYVGTAGILMQAFDQELITAEEAKNILKKLLSCDIRLSRKLCNKVLAYIGLEECFWMN